MTERRYTRHSWSLNSEGSFACHIYCDTGHPGVFFFWSSSSTLHTQLLLRDWQWNRSRHLRLSDYVCSFFQNNYWYALRFSTTSWCSQLYYFLAFYICEFQFLFQHVYCSFIINLYWLSMINLIINKFRPRVYIWYQEIFRGLTFPNPNF